MIHQYHFYREAICWCAWAKIFASGCLLAGGFWLRGLLADRGAYLKSAFPGNDASWGLVLLETETRPSTLANSAAGRDEGRFGEPPDGRRSLDGWWFPSRGFATDVSSVRGNSPSLSVYGIRKRKRKRKRRCGGGGMMWVSIGKGNAASDDELGK